MCRMISGVMTLVIHWMNHAAFTPIPWWNIMDGVNGVIGTNRTKSVIGSHAQPGLGAVRAERGEACDVDQEGVVC